MIDSGFIIKTLPQVLSGLPATFRLVFISIVISTPLALLVAIVNMRPERIASKILGIYISFVRSVPVIIIIYLFYHLLPLLLQNTLNSVGSQLNIYKLGDEFFGYIIFTIMSIPTLSEVFRSGLVSVDRLQMEASKSIGMTPFQAYIHVVLPQAVRNSLPVLCTFVTTQVKMSSLAFSMSIYDITGKAKMAASATFDFIECYLLIFIMYLIINISIEQIFKYWEKRLKPEEL
ncbi:MAG: amino acid ABC transporter permease [Butyrivibrio sp.]|nr:amino acid ABC transporter permease [Butyrivibrio sp.]